MYFKLKFNYTHEIQTTLIPLILSHQTERLLPLCTCLDAQGKWQGCTTSMIAHWLLYHVPQTQMYLPQL